MDIFISWSGERSRAAAEALRNWLPKIINAIKPWLSSADIDKGARWSTDVASRLEAAKAGIICLTPSNLHSDWILFEAGALSKTLKNTFVCPFLIGLDPSDVKPPLAQFQATRAVKSDVLKLIGTLNKALGEDALGDEHIKEVFDVWWPKLESQIKDLPADLGTTNTHRPDRELLEEILALVRNQNRVGSTTLYRKPPYEIIQGPIFDAIESAVLKHGDRIHKVTREIPRNPNINSYTVVLESGRNAMLTCPAIGPIAMKAVALKTQLEGLILSDVKQS